MTWARLDDNFHSHPRTLLAGLEANGLFARAISYCADYLTDGFVPSEWAEQQGGKRPITRLIRAGLIEAVEDGYMIIGYLERNPSRDEVNQSRTKDARKHSLHRDRDLVAAIRDRDGDDCRYCGVEVDWTDRRGGKGGTYDHVDPTGDTALNNVVVACRGCHAVKGKRTPEQAGIVLLPTPDLTRTRSGLDPGQVQDQVSNRVPAGSGAGCD
jgi:5-methylcytosine-specific restriction endonuclease McrA